MNHTEQRIWLIKELQKDPSQLSNYPIPADEQGQKDLLRGLMNIWMPKELSDEFLKIQDEYLTEENRRIGITDIEDLQPIAGNNRLYLWQGDMTTLKVSAIVNPANEALLGCFRILHSCADNIVHSKAGLRLRQTCNCIMEKQGHPEPTGKAKITPAYNLPCDYVIHTVGPIVSGRLTDTHKEQLKSCYRSCLELAFENDIKNIVFCCISTGVFGFPQKEAAEIAVNTVREFLKTKKIEVIFNVFIDADYQTYKHLLGGNQKTEIRN